MSLWSWLGFEGGEEPDDLDMYADGDGQSPSDQEDDYCHHGIGCPCDECCGNPQDSEDHEPMSDEDYAASEDF